jgi:hypothetical protein
MPRIAIVIGCSSYALPGNDLVAAGNDARVMTALLKETHAYDDVLSLVDNAPAATTKEAVTSFVERHQKAPIDEVFFFFSGHGLYRDGEFYYLLYDYDDLRPRDTALENTELDGLLRALRPQLTVKVVDACNSGVPYIKGLLDPTQFEKHIDETQQRFEKCYFLFSSSRDQRSYADEHLSYFTRAVLKAIHTRPLGPIRYKDLISAVADSFDGTSKQRPFFVTQADQTEVFCTSEEPLRTLVERALQSSVISVQSAEPDIVALVVQAARRDAERFVTQERALERLEELRSYVTALLLPRGLSALYGLENFVGTGTPQHPGASEVGDWLLYYGTDVFAKPTYKLASQALSAVEMLQGVAPRKYESKDVSGYEHTVPVPFTWMELKLKPLLPNIHPFKFLLVPLLSRSHVTLLTGICEYEYKTWSETKLTEHPKWNNVSVDLSQGEFIGTVAAELRRFWNAVAKHVTGVLGMKRDDAEQFLRIVRDAG